MYKLLDWLIERKNIEMLDITRDYIDIYTEKEYIIVTDKVVIKDRLKKKTGVTYETKKTIEVGKQTITEVLEEIESMKEVEDVAEWKIKLIKVLVRKTHQFVEYYNTAIQEFRIKTIAREYINIIETTNGFLVYKTDYDGNTTSTGVSTVEDLIIQVSKLLEVE